MLRALSIRVLGAHERIRRRVEPARSLARPRGMNLQNLVDLAQTWLDIPLWAGMGFLGVIYLMFRHQLQRNHEIHAALVTISNQLAELREPSKNP